MLIAPLPELSPAFAIYPAQLLLLGKTLSNFLFYLAVLSKTPAPGHDSIFPSTSLLPKAFDLSQIKLVARPYLDSVSFYIQV